MSPRPQPPRRCRECDQPILWWHNANREGGMLPVDPSSDDGGTIRKSVSVIDGRPVIYGHVLAGAALADAVASAEMLFTHHANTCTARRPVNPRPAHVRLNLPDRSRRRTRR